MKILYQFLIILGFTFAGEALHSIIPLPIPAGIYGIILLFAALETRLIRQEQIKQASSFLIEVMPIMFVPAAVGLIDSWGAVGQMWLQYLIATIVSTFVVMWVAGYTTQKIVRRKKNSNR